MLVKIIDGHELEIEFSQDQGGALKDAWLVCWTCDPEGARAIKFICLEQDDRGLVEITQELIELAEKHPKETDALQV